MIGDLGKLTGIFGVTNGINPIIDVLSLVGIVVVVGCGRSPSVG